MSTGEINASVVAELRRETGAGMMDCKKALSECGGDKVKALEFLRKKGIAAAEKRADRSASEGLIVCRISPDGKSAALVELNSETDFVARNEQFRKLADETCNVVLTWKSVEGKSVEDVKAAKLPSGETAGNILTDLIGKIGEKLEFGRFVSVTCDGYIGSYIHSDSKLGVLVLLSGATKENADVAQLGRDLAMQIAAASPTVVRREEIPAEKIASEREVETDRARNEGKPEAALPKIVEGRLNKWFADVALLEQPFVKDPKVFIKDLVAEVSKKAGATIEVKSFVRIKVGV